MANVLLYYLLVINILTFAVYGIDKWRSTSGRLLPMGRKNSLQIVTPEFLNPLHRLYIKKSCKFFQSYGKTSAIQNKFTPKVSFREKEMKVEF